MRTPRHLDIFTISFKSFEDFYLVSFEQSFQRAGQDVVLFHVKRLLLQTAVVKSLFLADVLVAHIKELFKAFPTQAVFSFAVCLLDFKYRVSPSDVLDDERE